MTACAYARYSTANQTENSIEYQLAKIRAFCLERGITITAVFTDEARSGTNTDRPGFQAMEAAARRKEFDAVVVYDISRGSRDVGDWFVFRKTMMMLGVQVISASQPLGDLANGNDFLMELLTVGLGQREVLETRQKSMDGVDVKAKQGAFLGGIPPLGYDVVNGAYVVNPGEAETVRTIFAMYVNGCSYNEIIEAIQGTTGKRGHPLGHNSLHGILTNERYVGVYSWNRKVVKRFGKWAGGKDSPRAVRIENALPAIVDRDTWERAQNRIKDRRLNAVNRAKREYLLSGLIQCEACGGRYVSHASCKNGSTTRYYYCGTRYRNRTCNAYNINAQALETFVSDNLKEYLESADITAEAARIAEAVNNATPDLTAERAELRSVTAQITNGVNAMLHGGAQIPELVAQVDALRSRKAQLEARISRQEAERHPVSVADVAKIFRYGLDHWEDNRKQVIRDHVQKITAHKDGNISVHVGVQRIDCGGGPGSPEDSYSGPMPFPPP